MYHKPALFIGDSWRQATSGKRQEVINPANEEVLGEAPAADAADVAEAIATAEGGFKLWSRTHGWERGKVLRAIARRIDARRAELAMALTLEVGRPLAQSDGEVQSALEQFDWFAGEAERLFGENIPSRQGGTLIIGHEPVGVVGGVYRLELSHQPARPQDRARAGRRLFDHSAAVGTDASTSRILVECCLEGGVPPEAIQLVSGNAAEISDAIMASPIVRKISLTGSTAVGKQLLAKAAATVKRSSMELGGHSPVIVCDDVDAEAVAMLCGQFKFRNAGQVCIFPTVFMCMKAWRSAFKKTFVAFAESLKLGDGRDPNTTMGPLTTRTATRPDRGAVGRDRSFWRRLLTGGRRPTPPTRAILQPHGVRKCPRRRAHHARRALRPGCSSQHVQRHRRSNRARQRHRIWFGCICVHS